MRALTHTGGFLIFGAATAAAVFLSGCEERHISRVKITAAAEVGGKIYSGSSVQEYSCRTSTHIMGDHPECRVKGEAVVVPIENHGDLFLIMNCQQGNSQTEMVRSMLGAVSGAPFETSNSELPAAWSLTPDQMPMLVRFNDLRDPQSIRQVDPKNLSKSYGPELSKVYVTVERTSAPIDFGKISAVIPWVTSKINPLYQHKIGAEVNPVAQNLSQYDFVSRVDQ